MSTCTVTMGFFVLRRCSGFAVAWCARCRRQLCAAHVAEAGLCPECAAGHGYGAQPGGSAAAAAAHHRRAFRARSATTYNDPFWYSSFDDYDRAAFAPGAGGGRDHDRGGEYGQDYDPDDGDVLVDS